MADHLPSSSLSVIVLGAGMVGVSTALHLQANGCDVTLIDRQEAGEEASHGNAGVIEKDGHIPLTIPKNVIELAKYASNRQIAMHYHPTMMPRLTPWLLRLWNLSNEKGIDSYARRALPLRQNAASEHFKLAEAAGIRDIFRETGWINLYHSEKSYRHTEIARRYADEMGISYTELTPGQMSEMEPHVHFEANDRGIYWDGAVSVPSPKRVCKAYANLYRQRGGRFLRGDARSLAREGDFWVVSTQDGPVQADKVVVALGAWSMDLLKPMGYAFPFAVKRGYHQHFASKDGAFLNRPLVDEEIGYLLTPMEDGIRLTTGIEFAHRDSRKTPVQLYRATDEARSIYPLGAPVEDEPWMGSRPCFPDALPVVEKASGHDGLYFNFGHAHMGFATGPLTGRLVAELVTGQEPSLDLSGLSSSRF